MKKITIIGHFAHGKESVDGQTIKTQNLANALSLYEEFDVHEADTYGWKKHPISLFISVVYAVRHSDAVIMLPAHNGVKVFSSILLAFRNKKRTKLYYDIVGAWLPSLIEKNPRLGKALKRFDGLWAETNTMKSALERLDFSNVTIVPNFKNIKPIEENELNYIKSKPIRLVIFSRISEMKGVTDAIKTLKKVNDAEKNFTLDIYGPIDQGYLATFNELLKDNNSFVEYKGVVSSKDSVMVLKKYHALLFPTKYYTEGIPGTIIDAYCAGLPIITSKWESYSDVCDEQVCALGYNFGDLEELYMLLLEISKNENALNSLKKQTLKKGESYTSKQVVGRIVELIGE